MEDMLPFHGLRGVCAMAIFLGHQTDLFLAPAPAITGQGRQGGGGGGGGGELTIGIEYLQAVSLFFLLSGIPLARLYSTKLMMMHHDGSSSSSSWDATFDFWRKRCARLAPIYYLTLVANLLVCFLICEKVDMGAAMASFFGCALYLQSWFVSSLINVGGVLWQVAVFIYGYALFPFYAGRIQAWTETRLMFGILVLWLWSLGLWSAVLFCFSGDPLEQTAGWLYWHVHCLSRLPHIVAGVFVGELVERKRRRQSSCDNNNNTAVSCYYWTVLTDILSLLLLATAIQAPIVQWYMGKQMRDNVSIGLEAILLPVHALWLAGIVLSYSASSSSNGSVSESRTCWTRKVLSFAPLVSLGNVSLVLYCLHLVVLFLYTATYAYMTTGDWHLVPTIEDYTMRVQVPFWSWHAPVQWILVIAVSFCVSNYFEAPLRKILAAARTTSSHRRRQEPQQPAATNFAPPSETTRLVV